MFRRLIDGGNSKAMQLGIQWAAGDLGKLENIGRLQKLIYRVSSAMYKCGN